MSKEKSKETIDFERFLRSIGGLENGFKYIPYYWTSFNFFGRHYYFKNYKYYIFNLFQLLGFKNDKNPFRDKIKLRGFFSCGDGWLPMIQELIEKAIKLGWNKQVCQVKEKFGGLRFYINGASDKVHDLISEYEKKSYSICENCGSTDDVTQTSGWIKSLCFECLHKTRCL